MNRLGKSPQIEKFCYLIVYLLKKNFMEEMWRKSALKTSLIPLFKQSMRVWDFVLMLILFKWGMLKSFRTRVRGGVKKISGIEGKRKFFGLWWI